MAAPPPLLLAGLRYAFPTTVFVYFLLCTAVVTCTFQRPGSKIEHPRRRLILLLMLAITSTYVAQCVLVVTRWQVAQQDVIVSLLACAMVFGLESVMLHDTETPIWNSYLGSFAIGLVFDPILAVLSLRYDDHQHTALTHTLDVLFLVSRLVCFLLTLVAYFSGHKDDGPTLEIDSERQALLRKRVSGESEDTLVTAYGAAELSSEECDKSSRAEPESEWERSQRLLEEQRDKRLQESGNWLVYARSFKLFLPYIWPVNDRRLQILAALVGVCLLVNNALNVLIPNQLGIVTRTLTDAAKGDAPDKSWSPWIQVLIFAGLKLSASEAGVSLLRRRLWLPVEQYSERAMVEAAHSHILNLDAQFHDTKSLSEMVMAIQHGEAISSILETVCFEMIPNLIDLAVAFVYLTVKFGPWEGLITISTSTVFIYLSTAAIARSRAAHQTYSKAWYEEWYIMSSAFSGWTTVASFNQVPYEGNRFSTAVRDRISKSTVYTLDVLSAQAVQYLVLLTGLLAGLFLAVWQVTRGHSMDASDFVVLLTYWSQLVGPLNYFAQLGKSVNRNLIDAERLLEIMETEPKVTSKPGAPPLTFTSGQVEFQGVRFSYDDKKEILKNISFSVEPGQTIAFVGQTGAGKSTILKLLDRFYDVSDGSIKIDGQDVREVDLYSLRSHIGVVPQNPVLFNDTIMDNVRYARLDASDDEVYEACKAAAIHEQILGFSDGYKTRVGERGMKLSGGELQRVAIARAILKRPNIVLLDEATSAVDTETESNIQAALRRLCKGRTTFIVAHRLSTIVNSDRIVVVNNGEILEQGTHDSLIAAQGKYAELWAKQIFVKPKELDHEQNSGGEQPLHIADDCTKSQAKVITQSLDDTAGEDGAQSQQVTTPSGHKRENSTLNPSAPEFTPRTMLAAAAAACSPTAKGMVTGHHDPFSQTLTPVHMQQSSVMTPVVSLPLPVKHHGKQATLEDAVLDSGRQSTEITAKPDGESAIDPERKKRRISYKIPRYVRRHQSRSEPAEGRRTAS